MIEVLDRSQGRVIGLRLNGKLVHADYQRLIPMLEELIEKHGSFRCYCEMADFHGITPHALWDEMKFDVKHCKDIQRCAIVGDKASHKWMSKIGGMIFYKANMKYFDVSESDKAWEWITEGATCCCCSAEPEAATTA